RRVLFRSISTDIRLKFASNQGGNDRNTMHKILDEKIIDDSSLHPTEKEKLTRRTARYSNFKLNYEKINKSSVYTPDSIDVMTIKNTDEKEEKVYETLSFDIDELDLNELKRFLIGELKYLESRGEITIITELRRLLLLLYDIRKNKGSNP